MNWGPTVISRNLYMCQNQLCGMLTPSNNWFGHIKINMQYLTLQESMGNVSIFRNVKYLISVMLAMELAVTITWLKAVTIKGMFSLIDALWRHIAIWILVNIGPVYGLLPDGIKQEPEPMLTWELCLPFQKNFVRKWSDIRAKIYISK